jgi:hypothetical protein
MPVSLLLLAYARPGTTSAWRSGVRGLVAIGGVAGGHSRWLDDETAWVLLLGLLAFVIVLLYDRRKR